MERVLSTGRPARDRRADRSGPSGGDGWSEHSDQYPAFLLLWHGLWRRRGGVDGLRRTVAQLQGADLPASEIEHQIFLDRIADYPAPGLDELLGSGEVVWQGSQSLGAHDGMLCLFLERDFPSLGRISVLAAGARERQLREMLLDGNGLEFESLVARLGGFPEDALRALWALAWNGEVTSDSLNALRARGSSRDERYHRRARPRYATRSRIPPGAAGRWSLLAGPGRGFAPEADRRLALARQLLDRYGVVSRSAAAGAGVAFENLVSCFEQLEARGEARRVGCAGSGGEPRFAAPAVAQVWRDALERPPSGILSACDPANPYGAILPWPEMMGGHRAQRTPGARVLVEGGRLIAYLTRNGGRLYAARDIADPRPLIRLLKRSAARGPVFLELINGEPPYETSWHRELVDAGFSPSRRGYLMRAGTWRE